MSPIRKRGGRPRVAALKIHVSVPITIGPLYAELSELRDGRRRAQRLKELAARGMHHTTAAPVVTAVPIAAAPIPATPGGSSEAGNDSVFENLMDAFLAS